jgi:serine/threonine protein kinase
VGNLMFMSPEQRDGAEATKQSDLYALGAILYYLLTGSRAEGRWKLPSELGLSRAWDEVVKTCLEPVVKERIGSAEALRVLIERTAARGAGMRRGLLIAAALLTVGLCAGLVFRWGSGDGRDPAPHGDSAAARAHPTTRGTGILPVPPAVPPTTTTTVIPIPPPTTTTLPPPAPAVALRDVAPLKADADLKLPEILKVPDGQGFEALKTPLPAVPDAAAQAGPAVGVVIVTLGALAAVAAIVLVAGVIAVRRNLSRRDG